MTDIKQHVEQLLYELDSLIIPNFGGFVSSYKSATVDHIQGFIHPPSKKLGFNKNLLINDGVLVNYLQKELSLSVNEAEKMIEDFVLRTQDRLNNREIVVFPGVGRLYKDYENNLQFLQDNTNFNTEVYGLPALQYYPILRSKNLVESISDQQAPIQKSASRRSFHLPKAANALIPIILIAVIAIAALFYINGRYNTDSTGVQTMPVAENRINKKPEKANQMSVFDGLKNQFNTPELNEAKPKTMPPVEELVAEQPAKDTEAATLAPEFKECVIIIGAFSKKAGVERRVKEIIDLGYSVYQDKKGSLTRVGIQFAYQEKSEIREKLNAMRDNFDNRSWILTE